MEYGDLILHCEVRWLSKGKVLSRFWEMKNSVYNFLEEKNELLEERSLLCNEKWLFDLSFSVDITTHLNDLNLKLQGKNKLFTSLVNDFCVFKTKLNIFTSQLKNADLCNFPHLEEQSEYADLDFTMAKIFDKIELLQESFESRFSDLAKEEKSTLAFINPFSFSEQNILKMPSNIQMEPIDLKTNLLIKSKFDKFLSKSNPDFIDFWQLLPDQHFPELRKFAQSYICRFGSTYRCEQAFSSMKLIKILFFSQ